MAKKVLAIFEKPIYLCMEPVDPHLFATAFGASGLRSLAAFRGSSRSWPLPTEAGCGNFAFRSGSSCSPALC